MQLIQARVSQTQVIPLSEHWQRLIMFANQHPFVTLEKLTFENGEPRLLEVEVNCGDVKGKETLKI